MKTRFVLFLLGAVGLLAQPPQQLSLRTVPRKFFGTAPPGSVPTNLPGDFFSDTTNHNEYYCGAPAGTAAPACSSVTTGGWSLMGAGGASITKTVVSFSATPTFTCATHIQEFEITLTGNVTSSTLAGCVSGDYLTFRLIQDGTGSRTFAWPTGFSNACSISPTLSVETKQLFYWDGTNAVPQGPCSSTDAVIPAHATVVSGGSGPVTGVTPAAAGTMYVSNGSSIDPSFRGRAILTCATTSASGTAEVCNTSPVFTPAAGDSIIFQADIANTGAFTLNVNSLGAKSVKKNGTVALVANDILASPFQALLTYDGTNWEMQGQLGNASGGGGTSTFIDHQGVGSPITGTGADATVFTTTLPTITAGHCVFYSWALNNGGSGTATYKIWLGATSNTFNISAVGNGILSSMGEWSICNKAGVQNAQESVMLSFNYGGTPLNVATTSIAPGDTTLTANLAGPIVLKLTFGLAATGTVTPISWNVRTN